MINGKSKRIIKEYFDTTSCLLSYGYDEQKKEIVKSVLELILKIENKSNSFDKFWQHIEKTDALQTVSERKLLQNNDLLFHDFVFDIKIELLEKYKINHLMVLDKDIFLEILKEQAFLGEVRACKLLACLYWLETEGEQYKDVAITIWEMLAISGDFFAMKALIFANKQRNNKSENNKWNKIHKLLTDAYESFVPIVTDDGKVSEEELELANLIIYVRQSPKEKSPEYLDRMLLYYVLHSKDSYTNKMKYLQSESNYNLLLQQEVKYNDKKFGF